MISLKFYALKRVLKKWEQGEFSEHTALITFPTESCAEKDKLVERWAQVDTLGILQQIDALPLS